MEFNIGASIFDRDGDELGHLTHVIVDPGTLEVTEIVLGESSLTGRDVIVPVGAVNSADMDGIQLQLDKDQTSSLEDFEDVRYVMPGAGTLGSVPWAEGALMSPGPFPVGAATGIESIAYTPIIDTTLNIPEGVVDLQPGTEVWATDGKVGHVRDVIVDEQTNRLKGFVVESGFLFHTDTEIAMEDVANVGTDRVTLTVGKDDLESRQ